MSSKVNFERRLLKVATNLSPPFVIMDYIKSNNTWILSGGFEVKLLKTFSEYFNFTYEIVNCNSNWGIQLANNTWTGIIGKIISKETDFGFAAIAVTAERSKAVYFSDPHIITSVSFITPPPKSENILTLVIEPFDFSIWICFIVAFILIMIDLWLISKYYVELKKIDINWALICFSLKQQVSFRFPPLRPLRIMISCWIMACVVLTSSYGGCLYSLMTFPSKMKTIDTVMQLANELRNDKIQVIATEISNYYQSLKGAKFGVHKYIGEFIKPVQNKSVGLDIVRNSLKPHAFISTRDHLIYGMLELGPNSFYLPPLTEESTIYFAVLGIAMQRDFRYKKEFNRFISDIKKGGFLDYWRLTEYRKLMKNISPDLRLNQNGSHEYGSLHLNQFLSALYLFVLGILLSLFILLIELVIKHLIRIS